MEHKFSNGNFPPGKREFPECFGKWKTNSSLSDLAGWGLVKRHQESELCRVILKTVVGA